MHHKWVLLPAPSSRQHQQHRIQSNNRHCNFEAIAVRDIFGMISNNLLELNLYDKYISLFPNPISISPGHPHVYLLMLVAVAATDAAMGHEWKTIMHRFLFNLELLRDNGCNGGYSKSLRLSHFSMFYSLLLHRCSSAHSPKRTQCDEKLWFSLSSITVIDVQIHAFSMKRTSNNSIILPLALAPSLSISISLQKFKSTTSRKANRQSNCILIHSLMHIKCAKYFYIWNFT